jgi:hypothetical protein
LGQISACYCQVMHLSHLMQNSMLQGPVLASPAERPTSPAPAKTAQDERNLHAQREPPWIFGSHTASQQMSAILQEPITELNAQPRQNPLSTGMLAQAGQLQPTEQAESSVLPVREAVQPQRETGSSGQHGDKVDCGEEAGARAHRYRRALSPLRTLGALTAVMPTPRAALLREKNKAEAGQVQGQASAQAARTSVPESAAHDIQGDFPSGLVRALAIF